METFESKLASATRPESRELLGAIGVVFDASGNVLYDHAAGRLSLDGDYSPVSLDTTMHLASAGRWEAPVAFMQMVESGRLKLDDSVFALIPELEGLPIIYADQQNPAGFALKRRAKDITYRHMLTDSSGLASDSHPLIAKWRGCKPTEEFPEGTSYIVKNLSMPLIFEPGEGWYYGESTHWLQLLFERASGQWHGITGQRYVEHMRVNIFEPLGMMSSAYWARPDISKHRLQMVERGSDGKIADAGDNGVGGIICSIADFQTVLVELISPEPRIVSKESMDLLFAPAFAAPSASLIMLRADTDDYALPAGLPPDGAECSVNYTLLGALAVEERLPISHLPSGTVTWNGSPNIVWAVNRQRGMGMLFATQLLPVDDKRVLELMMEFFRSAVSTFWEC